MRKTRVPGAEWPRIRLRSFYPNAARTLPYALARWNAEPDVAKVGEASIRGESPEVRSVVLTMYKRDQDVHRAIAYGAGAYLLKDSRSDELIRVVRDVHAG